VVNNSSSPSNTPSPKSKLKSIDVGAYLALLKLVQLPADLAFLKKIHKAHLIAVPFENLDIHYSRKISLDADFIFQKIVNEQRGGFCYELNLLLFHLLTQLGYDCHLVSAQVFNENKWSPDFEHMMIIVTILDDQWLVDVGFGKHFIEPKKLQLTTPQLDYTVYYKFERNDEQQWILKNSKDNAIYEPIYRFELTPKNMIEFIPRCNYHQESMESFHKNTKFITKLFRTGRITLTDRRLITELLGEKEEMIILNEDAFFSKLEYYFGIDSHKLVLQRFT
jgi:N-hydroxyarylamine O-acetyltransferase